mmetsp:Transcript_3837/g.10856  ORF Transcript_3837/g.10856 Transcript_3837/m.10856 type:complete len:255 (-) Transcript_3837:382-1146(-)
MPSKMEQGFWITSRCCFPQITDSVVWRTHSKLAVVVPCRTKDMRRPWSPLRETADVALLLRDRCGCRFAANRAAHPFSGAIRGYFSVTAVAVCADAASAAREDVDSIELRPHNRLVANSAPPGIHIRANHTHRLWRHILRHTLGEGIRPILQRHNPTLRQGIPQRLREEQVCVKYVFVGRLQQQHPTEQIKRRHRRALAHQRGYRVLRGFQQSLAEEVVRRHRQALANQRSFRVQRAADRLRLAVGRHFCLRFV